MWGRGANVSRILGTSPKGVVLYVESFVFVYHVQKIGESFYVSPFERLPMSPPNSKIYHRYKNYREHCKSH